MKEQKPKKHSLSSSLPLSPHVSTCFYLFPLPFILDMMCQMIYSVSNIDKVNRCLARYSPRATTTNRPTTGH